MAYVVCEPFRHTPGSYNPSDGYYPVAEVLCDACGVLRWPTDADRYADPVRVEWHPVYGDACHTCGADA